MSLPKTSYDVVSGRIRIDIDIPEVSRATMSIFATDFSGNESPVTQVSVCHIFTDVVYERRARMRVNLEIFAYIYLS